MRKKSGILCVLGTLSLVAIALFLPQMALIPPVKSLILKIAGSRIHGRVEIDQMHLSWLGPQRFQHITFSNPYMDGSIESLSSSVKLWNVSEIDGAFTLKGGAFSFPSYGGGTIDSVNASFQHHRLEAVGITQGGGVEIRGTIFSKEDFDLQVELKKVPAAAVVPWFQSHLRAPLLAAQILGETLNLQSSLIYNQGSGPFTCAIDADRLRMRCDAQLSDTELSLKQPFQASAALSQEALKSIATETKLSLFNELHFTQPVTIQVAPKNFSLPLFPLSLKKMKIGSATVDLGKVRCRKTPLLSALFRFLKAGKLFDDSSIHVWFTPVALSFEKERLELGRFDALINDSIHICGWGNIDFMRDRLDLRLGIPADTLAHSFGIQNLPKDYVLAIAIEGSLQNPEIATAAAAAKIATLAGAQQIHKKGKFFGGLFNVFIQSQEEEKAPPPSHPFPWEGYSALKFY